MTRDPDRHGVLVVLLILELAAIGAGAVLAWTIQLMWGWLA